MYPLNLFSLFPPFPRNNEVFVVMSFDKRFYSRWRSVIAPAVRSVKFEELDLKPFRVDVSKVSDSILTQILNGISECRLVLADISTIGQVDGKPVRNGNVMYELGIAHAVRLPEEVVLFKSDRDPLPFDVGSIRVHHYEPENDLDGAKQQVQDILKTSLDEIHLQKSFAVKRAADSIDFNSWLLLNETFFDKGMKHPWLPGKKEPLNITFRMMAIYRLLELGILSAKYTSRTVSLRTGRAKPSEKEILEYEITPFGKAVHAQVLTRLGGQSEGL